MSDTPADDTSHYEGALLEDIREQQKAILEAVGGLPNDVRELKANVAALQADMNDVKAGIKTIKAAVTDQTHQLDDYEHRLTRLEQKAA